MSFNLAGWDRSGEQVFTSAIMGRPIYIRRSGSRSFRRF